MHSGVTSWVPSAVAAGALVVLHLLSDRIRIFRHPEARSFGTGFALAYVFLHLLPDIGARQEELAAQLWLPHTQLFAVALLGLLGTTALIGAGQRGGADWHLYLPLATYNALLGRLLQDWEFTRHAGLVLTTLALAIHVGLIDRDVQKRDPRRWRKVGRFAFGGAVALGWLVGEVSNLPEIVRAHAFALVAGILIGTSLVTEIDPNHPVQSRAMIAGVIAFALLGLAIRPFVAGG